MKLQLSSENPKSCEECPYYLGVIKTMVNLCLQCEVPKHKRKVTEKSKIKRNNPEAVISRDGKE